jgi:hypothetical protein
MGTTSKHAREWKNGTRSTRPTRWCAHLRLGTMATEGLTGVGEESPALLAGVGEDDGADIRIEQSTTSRR